MMNLRITRVFLFVLLMASVEVQARILRERSHNSMVETNYGFSSPRMSTSSTSKSSQLKLLFTIMKKPILLETVTLSSFPRAIEISSWKNFEALPIEKKQVSPPPPTLAPPEHQYSHDHFEAALPYESPPNPFLASS